MQTLFQNPLAGPDVLGLSSGASLGVATIVIGATFLPMGLSAVLLSSYGIILASSLGSFLVLLAVLAVSQRLRDTMAILIVGLMFASLTSAIVGTLTYFSTAEQLQKFTFWSMGNLGNLSWSSIVILSVCVAIGLLLSLVSIKPLNALNPIDYHHCHQYFGRKYHGIRRSYCLYRISSTSYCQISFSN